MYKMLVSIRKTCQDKSMCIFRTEICILHICRICCYAMQKNMDKMLISIRKTCQDKSMCIFRTELCIFAGYAGMQRDIVLVLVAVANWTAGWTLVPPREASPMMLVEMMVMIIKAIMMFLMIREMMRLMVLKIIAILPSSTFVFFWHTL